VLAGPVLAGAVSAGAVPEGGAPEGGAPEDGALAAGGPDRDGLAAHAAAARETETGARLEVRTAEERLRAIAGRADALAAAAVAERRAAAAAAARRQRRHEQAEVASAVAQGAQMALAALAESLAVATADRQAAEQAREGRADALKTVRAQVRELAAELDRVVDSAHGAEIVQAERRMRLEQLAGRGAEEFGVDEESLIAEYGPDVPIPPPAEDGPGSTGPGGNGLAGNGAAGNGTGPSPAAGPANAGPANAGHHFVRAEQERRAAAAQRQLDQLGKVNPLALEEYAALEERHAFLAAQLEDLKKTRRDLLTVIKEVDDRVQQVFAAAFEDTAREFEDIFGRLFPGGQGRLVLTEPDDMLATGIDFEARPPGKKVKRLSLLSGGERSLTAIAFLVAIFKARPSPFYVLDEVEAALDDTNLQRLLQIFEELRATSQLLVVTHQKRTMEAADALYGISMQGDGVSTVVSQRLREPERA
jgi:chromosome segregation protein